MSKLIISLAAIVSVVMLTPPLDQHSHNFDINAKNYAIVDAMHDYGCDTDMLPVQMAKLVFRNYSNYMGTYHKSMVYKSAYTILYGGLTVVQPTCEEARAKFL